jgi:tetratricopeptide (TPR) repeat protein
MFGLVVMSSKNRQGGQYQRAEEYLREGLALAVRVGDRFHEAWFLEELARIHWIRGEYEQAAELAQRGLQLSRQMGERVCASFALVRQGEIATAEGRYDTAREHYKASLSIAREMSDPLVQVESLVGLAAIATSLQEHSEARQHLRAALSMSDMINLWTNLTVLVESGHAALGRAEAECAVRCFREALAVSAKKRFLPQALKALVGLACVIARQHRPLRAAEILAVVLRHSATYQVTKYRAQRLLAELESVMSREAVVASVAQGQTRRLGELIAEVLSEWETVSDTGSSVR